MGKLSCGLKIPGVFEKDGRYYKVVRNHWHKLTRIDEGQVALYRALYELEPTRPGTVGELINVYRANGMDELKPATRVDYLRILIRLDHHFGKMRLGVLKPSHVAVFLSKRKKAGRGAIRANREMAVLAAVHRFGMGEGWLESNPCKGVSRNTEHPRRRYVTHAELDAGKEHTSAAFRDLLEAAYITGVRLTDLISWTRAGNLNHAGIHYVQSKTGKPHEIEWTTDLRAVVRRAMGRADGELVFLNARGDPWTQGAISSAMRRLHEQGVSWRFKDLRAKAQTDAPHSVLGHGAALEAVYRKTLRTRPVR